MTGITAPDRVNKVVMAMNIYYTFPKAPGRES